MPKKLLTSSCLTLITVASLAQSTYKLTQRDTTLNPEHSTKNLVAIDTISFQLNLHGPAPATPAGIDIPFTLDVASLNPGHHLTLNNTKITVSPDRWQKAQNGNNTIDTFLTVSLHAYPDTLKQAEIARILITGQYETYVQLRISEPSSATDTGLLTLVPFPTYSISTYTDDAKTPQNDTTPVAFRVTGPYNPKYSLLHYQFNNSGMANKPKLLNTQLAIPKNQWDSATALGTRAGRINDWLFFQSYPVIDTGTLTSAQGSLKIKEDSQDSLPIFMTTSDKYNWFKKSNFLVIAFIKSISGTTAQSELLDIFLKVNLTSRKKLNLDKPLWFSLMGADAGLLSDTASHSKGLPLNEAILNVNCTFSAIDDNTTRVGFAGAGFKQFYGTGYYGAHIGVLEVGSLLKSSYIFVGYYYSPYVAKVLPADTAGNQQVFYRNNIYFEAVFNAFGDNVPKALQSIRLKFGLMMPIAVNDPVLPTSKLFNYRLAVEVPLGGPIKY